MRPILILAVLGVVILGGRTAVAESKATIVRGYTLDASFVPEEGRMTGRALVTLDSARRDPTGLSFFLHGELRVDSIRSGAARMAFEQTRTFYDYDYSLIANKVTMAAPRPTQGTIEIWYSGCFSPSKARSLSDYMRIDGQGVFLRAYGYSLWFPVFLDSRSDDVVVDFSAVTIRTPAEYTSVFVGTRTGERMEGGQRVTTWTAPATSLFSAQCTAQRYEVLTDGTSFLYHYPDSASAAMARAIMTVSADWNREFGLRYRKRPPAGQFHLMEMPRYGDISSGNVTGVTYWIWKQFTQDENAQRALGHELVHPYTAVPVARSDSLYSLAVEGFPSYCHLPILARTLGDDFYNRFLAWMESMYLEKRQTGVDRRGNPVPVEKPLLAIAADELSSYKDEFVLSDRALLFLNWLYARMGEQRFFEFTSEILNQRSLDARRFRSTIEKFLPGSREDVNTWLATSDYPERLHFENFKRTGGPKGARPVPDR